MVLLQLVMYFHVVVIWLSSSTFTLAAPRSTHALRNAKLRGIRADATYPVNAVPRNFTMELRPQQDENWVGEEFLNYVKDILAKKCPHKSDNKTCADDDAPTQVEDDFNKLNPTQQETIRKFMGGSRDTVTCAQLVRIKVGSEDETPENIACVLYFYDRSPNDMNVLTVPEVD